MTTTAEGVQPGRFIVLSSPSGGGKSTVAKRLLAELPRLVYSVSVTTRPPRAGEINGQSYWFLDQAEFEQRRNQSLLLEWEEVYDYYYGTPRNFAAQAVQRGEDVIFDLDVKGALKLKSAQPRTVTLFLYPPAFEILEERLRRRGTESEERLQRRFELARWECDQAARFDHVVINNQLEKTVAEVKQILEHYRKS